MVDKKIPFYHDKFHTESVKEDSKSEAIEHENLHPSVTSIPKRLIDILGSLTGLTLTALLFPAIILAIKLDSKGPVFYRQKRCGLMGEVFYTIKFRSMIEDAEFLKQVVSNEARGLIFKNEHDPRITRVGRFLRRTSLDELPQFFLVLSGKMSLVGTRPPTLDEVAHYEKHHWERLRVKPGLTGEWQVNGRSSIKNFDEVVKLDLLYQEHWSTWRDLKLIFQTLYVLFQRSGKY